MNITDTKILLSNYPRIQESAQLEEIGGSKRLDILCGYDIQVDPHQVTLQIANDLIAAILTYDKVYIEGAHIWDVMQVFGSINLSEMLRCDILHFIPDNTLNPVMKKESDLIWKPDFFSYSSGKVNDKGELVFKASQIEWGAIETTFFVKGIKGKDAQAFLYLVDEKKHVIDQNRIRQLSIKETINDLKNAEFVTTNSILRTNQQGLTEFHQLNILRLHELNTVAVTAGLLDADALKTDGKIGELMNKKCTSAFAQKPADGVASFQSILQKKGLPDLGELFLNRVIDLDDILKLRNGLQGQLFRYWALNNSYEEAQMQRDIMNSVHSIIGSKLSNAIRFIACNAVGFFSNVAGVAAAAFDSFILDTIAKGWHPNFFLDDKIRDTIDKCIKNKEEEEKKVLLRERFKGIGRNDLCPCGSGKKFKHCHGKR